MSSGRAAAPGVDCSLWGAGGLALDASPPRRSHPGLCLCGEFSLAVKAHAGCSLLHTAPASPHPGTAKGRYDRAKLVERVWLRLELTLLALGPRTSNWIAEAQLGSLQRMSPSFKVLWEHRLPLLPGLWLGPLLKYHCY